MIHQPGGKKKTDLFENNFSSASQCFRLSVVITQRQVWVAKCLELTSGKSQLLIGIGSRFAR